MLEAYGLSDIGKYREENQDRFLIDGALGLYAIADGMGGLPGGTAAASMALEGLAARMVGFFVDGRDRGDAFVREFISETLHELNARVAKETGGGGTTLVLLLTVGDRAFFANAGDSSGFLYRDRRLMKMTRDHNVAGVLCEMGRLTQAEARTHPSRNQLTSFLGTRAALEMSVRDAVLQKGDRLLLCSDGLTGMVGDDAIAGVLEAEQDPRAAVEMLIRMANEAGGYDNVTAVLADVTG